MCLTCLLCCRHMNKHTRNTAPICLSTANRQKHVLNNNNRVLQTLTPRQQKKRKKQTKLLQA